MVRRKRRGVRWLLFSHATGYYFTDGRGTERFWPEKFGRPFRPIDSGGRLNRSRNCPSAEGPPWHNIMNTEEGRIGTGLSPLIFAFKPRHISSCRGVNTENIISGSRGKESVWERERESVRRRYCSTPHRIVLLFEINGRCNFSVYVYLNVSYFPKIVRSNARHCVRGIIFAAAAVGCLFIVPKGPRNISYCVVLNATEMRKQLVYASTLFVRIFGRRWNRPTRFEQYETSLAI